MLLRAGRYTAFVRCYGGDTLTMTITVQKTHATVNGAVSCDGQTYQAFPAAAFPAGWVGISTAGNVLQLGTFYLVMTG
jgi:hypothetical protein